MPLSHLVYTWRNKYIYFISLISSSNIRNIKIYKFFIHKIFTSKSIYKNKIKDKFHLHIKLATLQKYDNFGSKTFLILSAVLKKYICVCVCVSEPEDNIKIKFCNKTKSVIQITSFRNYL